MHTRVDELLLVGFPTLFSGDLGLDAGNLDDVKISRGSARRDEVGGILMTRTVSEGSASMTNLFCLRS